MPGLQAVRSSDRKFYERLRMLGGGGVVFRHE
jgi:hypothetical protein